MCGINGGVNVSRERVNAMVNATKHRGPDATGLVEVGSVVFGHNRLAIIDTLERSNQPMISPDGNYLLVFNGEIYNFQSLKKELSNWNFVTTGDTEVLLAALATWGEVALQKLSGIFSFAFYDVKEDTLLLARDQLGTKPIYYTVKEQQILFSSELSGIIAGLDNPLLDIEAVSQFLHYNYVPAPKTLIEGVSKLQPGHSLRFSADGLTEERYYTPDRPSRTIIDLATIRHTIGQEVQSQLVSDRPLGVLLSGGFDSSIVLHHASTQAKMKTFTTGFEMSKGAETEFDKFNADARVAKQTADHYGAEHTEFMISLDLIRKEFISIIESLDEPINSPTQVSQFLLTRFIRQAGVVVALGGDGGDELWGGYIRHQAVLAAQYYQRYVPRVVRIASSSLHPKLRKLNQPLGPHIHFDLTALEQTGANRVLKQSIQRATDYRVVEQRYEEVVLQELSPIEQFMRADRELWLADDALQRTDRSSMANGVEVRVPLLGLSVVQLSDKIKAESKFSPWQSKKMLKKAYRGYLPDHLYHQPKRGWMAPGAKWLRDAEIEKQVRQILSSEYYDGLSNLFDWSELQILMDEHKTAKQYHLNPIWNVIVLQIWARKFNVRCN